MAEGLITRRGGSTFGGAKSSIINVGNLTDLPVDSKEGTIAIISAIPPKEIFISDTEPSSTTLGDLWLYPTTSGVINYNKNGQNYVIGIIYQYNGTRWASVPRTQYKNGSWLSTTVYLLNGTDHAEGITGGWVFSDCNAASVTIPSSGEGFTLTSGNSTKAFAEIQTENKIDLSGYNKIIFSVNITQYAGTDYRSRAGIQEKKTPGKIDLGANTNLVVRSSSIAYVSTPAANGEAEVVLPIDAYNDYYYVGIGGGTIMTVTAIRMEV